jgi:hypothetical protein
MISRFICCDLCNDEHAGVYQANAVLLQAWGICNAYKHGTIVADVSGPPPGGAGLMAVMLGHNW